MITASPSPSHAIFQYFLIFTIKIYWLIIIRVSYGLNFDVHMMEDRKELCIHKYLVNCSGKCVSVEGAIASCMTSMFILQQFMQPLKGINSTIVFICSFCNYSWLIGSLCQRNKWGLVLQRVGSGYLNPAHFKEKLRRYNT